MSKIHFQHVAQEHKGTYLDKQDVQLTFLLTFCSIMKQKLREQALDLVNTKFIFCEYL